MTTLLAPRDDQIRKRAAKVQKSVEATSQMSEEEGNDNGTFMTLRWDEIPVWQHNNEYILTGYRPVSGSYRKSLRSVKHVHNEMVNIWSHLVGSILFFALPIWVYTSIYPRYTTADWPDILVFSTFFFGVAICFALSAGYHIFLNHSERIAQYGIQLDSIGIVILMWGATMPSIYYGLYCDPLLQKIYWVVATIFAAACVAATLDPRFHRPGLRAYRAGMYAGLGLSAIAFVIHGLVLHGWHTQLMRMSLDWMFYMALLNFTGAIAYAVRVPERWMPLRYDIYGHSHQILHFMVIFAGIAHMFGLLRAFDFIHGQAAPCAVKQ